MHMYIYELYGSKFYKFKIILFKTKKTKQIIY